MCDKSSGPGPQDALGYCIALRDSFDEMTLRTLCTPFLAELPVFFYVPRCTSNAETDDTRLESTWTMALIFRTWSSPVHTTRLQKRLVYFLVIVHWDPGFMLLLYLAYNRSSAPANANWHRIIGNAYGRGHNDSNTAWTAQGGCRIPSRRG